MISSIPTWAQCLLGAYIAGFLLTLPSAFREFVGRVRADIPIPVDRWTVRIWLAAAAWTVVQAVALAALWPWPVLRAVRRL